jgi:hypothetical protein
MKDRNVKVFVNLEENTATVQVILYYKELFSKIHNNTSIERFFIESDIGGCSYIERKDKKYYFKNILRNGNERKVVEEKELTEEKVKELIRKVIKERIMNKIRSW